MSESHLTNEFFKEMYLIEVFLKRYFEFSLVMTILNDEDTDVFPVILIQKSFDKVYEPSKIIRDKESAGEFLNNMKKLSGQYLQQSFLLKFTIHYHYYLTLALPLPHQEACPLLLRNL